MKTDRSSISRVTAILLLLCSILLGGSTARACVEGIGGPTSFTATPGGSQTLTWTAWGLSEGDAIGVTLTDQSGVFTISHTPVILSAGATANFTVTFTPGANATGTYTATLACPCGKAHTLVGSVAALGVPNSLPSNVLLTITPNPATAFVNFFSTGMRTAEIKVYDLLGNEIASSKTTNWKFDATSIAAGSYLARITGESNRGEQFAILRRIIISR